MDTTQIKKILVESFSNRLEDASEALLYSIYSEYLKQLEEEKEGVKTNEV